VSRAPITKPVPVSNNFARGLRKLWERGTRCYRPNTQRLTQTGLYIGEGGTINGEISVPDTLVVCAYSPKFPERCSKSST
jgi:hypothetical protein